MSKDTKLTIKHAIISALAIAFLYIALKTLIRETPVLPDHLAEQF